MRILRSDISDYSSVLSNRLQKYAPLLKEYNGTTLFGYTRIFPSSSFIILSNDQQFNSEYHKLLLSQKKVLFCESLLGKAQDYYAMIWHKKGTHPSMRFFIEKGYWNGITLMRFKEHYVELLWFCSDLENDQIGNSYAKNYKRLIDFSSHFLLENKDIMDNADLYEFQVGFHDVLPNKDILESTLKIEQLKTKKLFDSILKPSINLSKQEYICVELLAQGRSTKEIAKALNLSPRTVESYMANIRSKAPCNFKSEVLDMFFDNRFTTDTLL